MTKALFTHGIARPIGATAAAVVAVLALSSCNAAAPAADDGAREFKLAVSTAPNSLDPAQLVDGQQSYVWGSVYDTLLVRENGTGDLKPNAAESWQYNEDGTVLTLEIRDGMTFSDGSPVDANAVAKTLERTKTTPGIVQPKLAHVTEVVAVDADTVEVKFDQHDPRFLYLLSKSVGAVGDPATIDNDKTATDPVGSGPYVLDQAQSVAGDTYVLTKRKEYWNAEAFPFSTVTVRLMPDSTAAFNALQAGEIDATTVRQQLLGQLDKSTFTVKEWDAQSTIALNILDRGGEKFPALGDVRVRQAINYALDRAGVVTRLFGDSGVATNQIFNPFGEVFDEELNGAYPLDPEKGRSLVQEAGFTGTSFRIPSTFLSTPLEATLTQAFESIGLGLEWVAVPAQQAQTVLTSGEYGIYLQNLSLADTAGEAADWFGPDGYANPQKFTDPTIQGYLADIAGTVDAEQALPIYRDLNEYVVKQAYLAPIAFGGSNWVTRGGAVMLDDGSAGGASIRLFGIQE